jgi:hypothetical protein
MYRYLSLAILLWSSAAAHAQLSTEWLQCGEAVMGAPFKIKFTAQTAELIYKGDNYSLKFNRAWRSQDGETWTDYMDDSLVVTTNIPSDSYVSVGKKGSMHSTSSCDVQAAK